VALAALGLGIMRSKAQFSWVPEAIRRGLAAYDLANPDAVAVGGLLCLAGAAWVVLLISRRLPDALAEQALAVPQPRRDPVAWILLGTGLGSLGLLDWRLAQQWYAHTDIALFAGGLALIAWGIDRLDRPHPPSTLKWTYCDTFAVVGVAALAIAVNAIDLRNWNFAWIGDEGAFFGLARSIATGSTWNFFDLNGVYGEHPVMDSVWQAGGMLLFGPNIIGWRVSEVLIIGASAALIYPVGLALLGRWPALVAAVVLGTNHYLTAAARIAKTHQHTVLFEILVLLMLVLAWRTRRAIFVYALGVAMGLCLYTFTATYITWLIVALLLLIIFLRRPTWLQVGAGLIMGAAFILVVAPGLLVTPLDHVLHVILVNSRREEAAVDPWRVARLSITQSFLTFWENPQWYKHFVGGPILDMVSGVLAVVGVMVGFLRVHKRAERLILLWFLLAVGVQAATNYTSGPSFTRLFYALPAAALLAGLGTVAVQDILRCRLGLPPRVGQTLVLLVCAAIPVLNVYQWLVVSPTHLEANRQVMILKELEQHPQQLIVEVGPQDHKDDGTIGAMLRAYPDLIDHYRYLGVADLAHNPFHGPGGSAPVYLLDKPNAALRDAIGRAVPPGYTGKMDRSPSGNYELWLWEPGPALAQSAPVPPAPSLITPSLVATVQLPADSQGQRPAPRAVAADPSGAFYVGAGPMIWKFNADGKPLPWTGAPISGTVSGITIANDVVYVLTLTPTTILRYDGQGQPLGAPWPAPAGSLSLSRTLLDNLLVVGSGKSPITRIDAAGTMAPIVGNDAHCGQPFTRAGAAVETAMGGLIVFDSDNGRIQHLSWFWCQGDDPSYIHQWSTTPRPTPTDGQLAIDRYGRVFLTAPRQSEVRIYTEDGGLLAQWPQPVGEAPLGIAIEGADVYLTYPQTGLVRKYHLHS
jgi:hypothetical protein